MNSPRYQGYLLGLLFTLSFIAPLPRLQAALKNPGTLVYAHLGEITTLDPVYPYDAATQGMLLNVYDTLIRYRLSSLTEFEPALALKVPSMQNGLISKDALTYRFPLRKDVKFHNGARLTPEDARYSLLRFMLTGPAGGPAPLLLEPVFGQAATRGTDGRFTISKAEFEKAVTADRDAVTVRLKKPFAPFLAIMARWSYITNKKWCAANGEWDGAYETLPFFNDRPKEKSGLFKAMNGTGPFALERWDQNLKLLSLTSFTGYWSSPAKLKRVILKTVPEFGARRAMLETGDADIADIPRQYEAQAAGIPGVRLEDNLPRLVTDPVLFFTLNINAAANTDIGSGRLDGEGIPANFFASADIRKAFSYSFDYAGYLKEAFKGKAARARGTIPPGLTGYNPAAPAYDYNRTRAEEHFRKAFNGEVWNKGFRLTLAYNTGGTESRLACETLKRGVEAMNMRFHINLRAMDWPVYTQATLNRKIPMFTRGWTGDYPDPHNFTFPFYHSRGRYAAAQEYTDPEMDKLIDTAVSESSPARRALLYARVQVKAYEAATGIYTAHPKGLYARRDHVHGFYDNPVFMGIYFYPLFKQ